MTQWQVHATITEHNYGRTGHKYTRGGDSRESRGANTSTYVDDVTVEASSPLQARVRGMAHFRSTYPNSEIRVTSVHQVGESEGTDNAGTSPDTAGE